MKVHYERSGGRLPPRDREILEISEDGSFTLWRSVGWATHPPTPVGRFAGRLDTETHQALRVAAVAAVAAGDLHLVPKPDAAIETVQVDSAQAKMGTHEEPPGAWGMLMTHLRQLLGELTNQPQAALALEVVDSGRQARLVHLGHEPLRLDFTDLTVRAVLWEGHRKVGDWWAVRGWRPSEGAEVTATAGWSLALPFDHDFVLNEGREVTAFATLAIYDGERRVSASLNTPRQVASQTP
ncbi:MAG: hypothetical protein AB1791_15750 [Chloroflexota bacterium]